MLKRIKEFSVATLAILALAAAMSEGPYFPWSNLVGVIVIGIIGLAAQGNEGSHG